MRPILILKTICLSLLVALSACDPGSMTEELGNQEQQLFRALTQRNLFFPTHEDDDLLFMQPDIQTSIDNGDLTRVVFITGGDNCLSRYPAVRENGIKSAYSLMATGVKNHTTNWTCNDDSVYGSKTVHSCTLVPNPNVTLVFLRITDCRPALWNLWHGSSSNIAKCVKPNTHEHSDQTYSKAELQQTLTAIIDAYDPHFIGSQDPNNQVYGTDHAEHIGAARFVFEAHQRYRARHDYTFYRAYNITSEQLNLSSDYIGDAWDAVTAYCQLSGEGSGVCGFSNSGGKWTQRRYASSNLTGSSGFIAGLANKCLDVRGGNFSNGTPVQLWDCVDVPAQRWEVTGSGQLRTSNNKCLDIPGGSTSNGTNLQIWDCNNLPHQTWTLLSNGQVMGKGSKCLDVEGANSTNGTPVQIWECVGDSSALKNPVPQQRWTPRFGSVNKWSAASQFGDGDLDTDESYWGSFNLADVSGDGFADACARRPGGIYCAKNNQQGGFYGYYRYTSEFRDTLGWHASEHGTTIRMGDINGDGKSDICGRGNSGIICAVANAYGSGFINPKPWTTLFSDAQGWNGSPSYYRSIDLADINGDGDADLCSRAPYGIYCALSNGNDGFVSGKYWITTEFTNGLGWDKNYYGGTVQLGDINGDGLADVCGRGSKGIHCATSNGQNFENAQLWSFRDNYSNAAGWASNQSYYYSIRLADVDGDGLEDVCGRSSTGIVCGYSTGFHFDDHRWVVPHDYSNRQSWNLAKYGTTIQMGDLNNDGHADLCGRGMAGLLCTQAP